MKKILLSLLALANCVLSFAKQVDEQTAKTVGYNFLKTQTHAGIADKNAMQLAYKLASPDHANVYLYVFNTGANGFVVVSGDDIANPVLGYSDEGAFDATNMPPELTYMTNGFKSDIAYAMEHRIPATSTIQAKWTGLKSTATFAAKATAAAAVVAPLCTTKWNQSPYYNYTCPYDAAQNSKAVTGCVATAMAQVMKYWNYPATGTGSHSYTPYSNPQFGVQSVDFSNTTFRWNVMNNTINQTSMGATDTLMYAAGVSVDMDYGLDESGAYVISSQSPVTNCAEYALKTYFGYKTSLAGLNRNDYNTDQWMELLKMELNASRPVIYAGYGTQGGHCWVADGYDANDFLHLNWGWGGASNGYFSVDAMDPASMGPGNGFDDNHMAIIGIEPAQPTVKMDLNASVSAPGYVNYNSPFSITTNIINNGTDNFGGDYIARVFDNNTATLVDSIQLMPGNTLAAGTQTGTLTFGTTGSMAMTPGQYIIGIYYRPTGSHWLQVNDNGSYTNLIPVTVGHATNVAQVANSNSITVFPNPATDVVHVSATGANIISVTITDLQGRAVKAVDGANNQSTIAVPVSELAAGMYFAQTKTSTGVQTDKIVIKK